MTGRKTSAKEKVIEVTEELIEKKGYTNVSARTIAKDAEISVGTLYHHFPNGKIDVLLALAEKYSDILEIKEFLSDPNADLRTWLQKDLRLSQKKREFITAMEIEVMSRPDDFKSLFSKSIELREENQEAANVAYKMMEKFAGKKISNKKAYKMILVLKSLIRRHVVFGNIFGSDDEFIDLLLTIIQAIVEG